MTSDSSEETAPYQRLTPRQAKEIMEHVPGTWEEQLDLVESILEDFDLCSISSKRGSKPSECELIIGHISGREEGFPDRMHLTIDHDEVVHLDIVAFGSNVSREFRLDEGSNSLWIGMLLFFVDLLMEDD